MTKLSEAAEAALLNTPARQGASSPDLVREPAVTRELRDAGAISSHYALTRRGLILRGRVMSARLEAFGEL